MKKKKERLVPIKKMVFDSRVGKSIERTYYINPNKKKGSLRPKKTEKSMSTESTISELEKFAQKVAYCNW